MKKNNLNNTNTTEQHCYWVWYESPINGEHYVSLLATSPEEALRGAGRNKKNVSRVFDCYDFKNYDVSRGTITN